MPQKVAKVYYPGLETHPGHAIAKAQMNGAYGGVIAFDLKGMASFSCRYFLISQAELKQEPN